MKDQKIENTIVSKTTFPVKAVATEVDQEQLLPIIEQLLEYEKLVKEANLIIDNAKGQLKTLMEERGVNELKVGIYKMHYTDCTRTDIDKEAFKEAMPGIYEQFLKTTSYKRFSIR
jgi:predicted phage-related endonuclease